MNINELFEIEQMDPDFGRYAAVGDGFGTISDEAYAELEANLNSDKTQ